MPMEQTSKKHSYGGRTCMACGGMACKVSYEELRKQVEAKRTAPKDSERAGVDSKPSIDKGMRAPLGHYAEGGLAHDPSKYDKDGNRLAGASPTPSSNETPTSSESHARDQLANAFGHAKGGEIDADDASDGDHDMMMDQCAHECMEAMKSGDKAMFKDALYTLMADMMSKMGKDE